MRSVRRTVSPWEQGWRPPAGVGDHSGEPLRADVDFFAPPPEELGPVISADSSARVGEAVCPWWLRFAVIAGVTALLAAVVDTATLAHSAATDRYEDQVVLRGVMDSVVVLGGVAALALLKWPRTARQCSYVCRDGVATFTLRSGRRVTRSALLPFSSVGALFDPQHDVHYHGLYGGTKFRYTRSSGSRRVR